MRVLVWILRFAATALVVLMIFPTGFNTFFGHPSMVDWTEASLYVAGLCISIYCERLAWTDAPRPWRLAGGYMAVFGLLTLLFAAGLLTVVDA